MTRHHPPTPIIHPFPPIHLPTPPPPNQPTKTPQEELRDKYEDRLQQASKGPQHHNIARVFKVLSGKKVGEGGYEDRR